MSLRRRARSGRSRRSPRGSAILADVSIEEEVRSLIASVIDRYGGIDILVNNAARGMRFVNEGFMTDPRPFWEAAPEAWRMIIDTNVTGVFLVTREVVPHMIGRGYGRIINISINAETMKRKGFSPYGPSKAALESMSTIWAQELAGTGVTLNLLLPGGATNTGMIPDSLPDARRRELLDPDVMGPPAVYLASEETSSVNGQRIIAVVWMRERAQP